MFPLPSIKPGVAQQGFSLIELMVATALGLVLTGAAIQFMISSNQTYNLNDDLSRVQENGRVAMDILAKDVRRAGYQEDLAGIKPHVVLVDCSGTTPCAADGATDTLSLQYAISTSITTDCLGNPVGGSPGDVIANVYTVQDPEVDGVSSLYCQGYNVTTEALIPGGPQPLVDGIDGLQVLYRVQSGSNYQYKSFSTLTTAEQENITAIRIGLLVSNGQDTGRVPAQDRTYKLLDSDALTIGGDTQVRRIYTTTIQLNNRHAGT